MTINDMRAYISSKYPGMKWKYKVSKMPTYQVIAIYRSFKEREIDKKYEEKKLKLLNKNKEPDNYHQIDMFEYMYSINEGKETHTEVNV